MQTNIQYWSNGGRYENLSLSVYLVEIHVHLRDLIIIINRANSTLKIHLTVKIIFRFFKDISEECDMYFMGTNMSMLGRSTSKLIEALNDLLYIKKIWKKLNVVVLFLHYSWHKTIINCDGWYINSQEWLKNKKGNINPKIDKKWFHYVVAAAFNYEEILNHPERVSNIRPFIIN